ncbi:MAG: TetR/AcrR family transcriptional regulator [Treponema sp.]|nr:TetR/AcrR family transcriptional regulator [Candidatus Treponema caballi]
MAIVVEHDKRKSEILDKALDIFVEEGYEDVTYQKIADKCGITRTTLYVYFKNKREIFQFSIKQLIARLETDLTAVLAEDISNVEKLRKMLYAVLKVCETNKKLFNVLLPYLISLQKAGKDSGERVRRRVVRMRHYMTQVFLAGQKACEFRDMSVKTLNEMFYSLIEAVIFRLAILNDATASELYDVVDAAIEGIKR